MSDRVHPCWLCVRRCAPPTGRRARPPSSPTPRSRWSEFCFDCDIDVKCWLVVPARAQPQEVAGVSFNCFSTVTLMSSVGWLCRPWAQPQGVAGVSAVYSFDCEISAKRWLVVPPLGPTRSVAQLGRVQCLGLSLLFAAAAAAAEGVWMRATLVVGPSSQLPRELSNASSMPSCRYFSMQQ